MMKLPAYFLPQPTANWDAQTIAGFERLWKKTLEQGAGAVIDYNLSAPKWQFLCYLCDWKGVVLHGSGKTQITEFETRKANDVTEFGNRSAVYAASDGIWAMYFAIVNRDNAVTSLINACFRIIEAEAKSEPYYFFSINSDALLNNPWREGTVSLLPGETFEPQPRQHYRGLEIESAQWASPVPVKPLAHLVVRPEDFPFLAQMRFHAPNLISERAAANPEGFPWTEE